VPVEGPVAIDGFGGLGANRRRENRRGKDGSGQQVCATHEFDEYIAIPFLATQRFGDRSFFL
jgi:hypothetical protein